MKTYATGTFHAEFHSPYSVLTETEKRMLNNDDLFSETIYQFEPNHVSIAKKNVLLKITPDVSLNQVRRYLDNHRNIVESVITPHSNDPYETFTNYTQLVNQRANPIPTYHEEDNQERYLLHYCTTTDLVAIRGSDDWCASMWAKCHKLNPDLGFHGLDLKTIESIQALPWRSYDSDLWVRAARSKRLIINYQLISIAKINAMSNYGYGILAEELAKKGFYLDRLLSSFEGRAIYNLVQMRALKSKGKPTTFDMGLNDA